MAYPLDTCVNTEASASGASYGIYTCNDDGDTVTYTHFEGDSSCNDANVASTGGTYTMIGLEKGDLFSFECNGINSYVETKSTLNDPTCSESSAITKIATNICYKLPNGDYAMYVIYIIIPL